jgi:hypothetical protein
MKKMGKKNLILLCYLLCKIKIDQLKLLNCLDFSVSLRKLESREKLTRVKTVSWQKQLIQF